MGVLPAQLLTEKGTEEEDDDEAVSVLEVTCLRPPSAKGNLLTCLMCKVIPEVLDRDMKKCSTISVWKVPILSLGISKSQLKCGLPDKS